MKRLSTLDMSPVERSLYVSALWAKYDREHPEARRGPIIEPGHPDDPDPDDDRIANRMTRSMDAHRGGVVW